MTNKFTVVLGGVLVFALFANTYSSSSEESEEFEPTQTEEEIESKQVPFFGPKYVTYYEWKQVEFDFEDKTLEKKLTDEKKLIQKNIIISAPKIHKDRMFLSLPRYMNGGVPVTFASVPYKKSNAQVIFKQGELSPKLKPFPSYEMQEEGNCSAFQLVQSMEVDQFGRLWVVDPGRTALLLPQPNNKCPAKLVVFDLNDSDKHLFTYTFPADVVSPTRNSIKDISIACITKDDCWVYISDLFDSKLIIYNYEKNESWSASHPTMKPDKATMNYTINSVPVSAPSGITSNVVSPKSTKFNKLYFTSVSSENLFMIETKTLQNPKLKENNTLAESDVKNLGKKKGQSDGMAMSNDGILYFGSLPQNAVYKTKLKESGTKLGSFKEVAQNDKEISWADTFAFDNNNFLCLTTTKFQLYSIGKLNDTEVRYRVVRFRTNNKAYSA